ncbi:MAG: tetratricopeptide repeat protein [Candidatus Peribacteraceae bacterium]|nr:tetratricopeptide repeat protein [Candidatus Peribacteraceae bacterium]
MKRPVMFIIALFFALSALVYGKAVWQSEFVRWDDGMLVYENPAIREISPATIKHIFSTYDPELYIPVTFFSYQIDYQIGGIHPFQYHLTNFLFHTFNALLVAWFVMLIFVRGQKARSLFLGIFCGLLFLLHPLHTEGVMWVSGRKDLLSTFFLLLTLIYWVRWRENPVRRWYLMAIGFFALALMSKVMAITLPVILLLIDWQQGRLRETPLRVRQIFTEKIPFFALSIIFGLIGIGGKTKTVASSSTLEKILMAGKSSVFYLRKILWPDNFSLLYPYHKDVVLTSPDFYIPIIVWVVILIIIVLLWRRTRDVAFGVALYAVTVAPTFLNFTKGGDLDVYFASDRYAYFPSIGVFIAVVALISLIAKQRIPKQIAIGIGACVIIALGVRSYVQSQVWRTTYTLLTNVLVHYPESHVAHNNIANAWRLEGRLDDAIGEFEKALAIRPHAKIYANLGAVYRKQGKIPEALEVYRKGIELNPHSREIYMGRSLVWIAQKNYVAAEQDLLRALQEDPTYLEAHINLGATYAYQGNMQKAIEQYRIAINLNPFYPDVRFNLGVALQSTGDIEGAMAQYERAVHLAPRSIAARINYGILLYKTGDADGAREQFEEILTIDPENATARSALEQLGQ